MLTSDCLSKRRPLLFVDRRAIRHHPLLLSRPPTPLLPPDPIDADSSFSTWSRARLPALQHEHWRGYTKRQNVRSFLGLYAHLNCKPLIQKGVPSHQDLLRKACQIVLSIRQPSASDCGGVSSLSAACEGTLPTEDNLRKIPSNRFPHRGSQGDDTFWTATSRTHTHHTHIRSVI